MPYQIGLCDDEVYQVKVNSLFLKEIASQNQYDLEYHGFQSGKQLRSYLEHGHLDVLFLDIDMGEETGIEIAAWIAKNYPHIMIIFVTGHREFAEEVFEVEAMGYLVKPYDIRKMDNVMKKVMARLDKKDNPKESQEIIITDENLKKKVKCKDIIYIQRQQYKSVVVTGQRQYGVYEPVTSLYEKVGEGFLRVNQSEVVNMEYIMAIEGNIVKLKNGMEMSIGRTCKKEVMRKYFGA